jgi:hypothetical protein
MPFDGLTYRRSEALSKLDAVIDLLATEDRWCKGALKNLMGQRCLMGAMQEAHALILKPYVLSAIRDVTGKNYHTVESFNDRRTTTHALVLDVLQHARHDVETGRPPVVAGSGSLTGWCRSVFAKCAVKELV